jgi:hypothetical protein
MRSHRFVKQLHKATFFDKAIFIKSLPAASLQRLSTQWHPPNNREQILKSENCSPFDQL